MEELILLEYIYITSTKHIISIASYVVTGINIHIMWSNLNAKTYLALDYNTPLSAYMKAMDQITKWIKYEVLKNPS